MDTDEVKELLSLLKVMYNVRLSAHEIPKLSVLKKIMYATKIEEVFPNPDRISMESMRRTAKDSPITLLGRLVWGTVLCAAGAGVKDTQRDDEAGWFSSKYPSQWCNAMRAKDLMKEVDEVRDQLGPGEQMVLAKRIHKSMFKSTSTSNETASLSFSKNTSKVHELPSPSGGETVQKVKKRSLAEGGGPPAKAKKKKGLFETKVAEATEAEKGAKSVKWADKAGELGPNDLPRVKGGNKSGSQCVRFFSGEGCKFNTCSFSHEADLA